jgi:D-beta-D-heptose 7-phosphate kinase/D-beta-D-heptose 1-phosphate adenosyltransferase
MRVAPRSIFTTDEAAEWSARLRKDGKRVVFTNGVFDIVHPGHVRYLRDARALGDVLIVAVNSDRSVRANKGSDRPINPERERAEVLAALEFVDAVVVFDEETPHEIVSRILPNVLVKGADWGENHIVGRDVVEMHGGRVVRMELAPGFSTTGIIEKIKNS